MGDQDEVPAKRGGYTYWKRDIDDAHILPDNRPQKMDASQAAAAAETAKADSVSSSWNSAGTWEEKDMSSLAIEELQKIFCDKNFALMENGSADRVCAVAATVSGDCQAYHIRGRPRLGFELTVNLSWKGTFNGEEVTGDLSVQDLDSSDLDGFEIRSTTKGSEASKKAADALKKGARPAIKKAAELLSQRLLSK
mmetsp:Transcript_2284/g.4156  ORF Transcript_2284/g.4156 Transcript_2284/m.4156 type:complete len:195 (-) Transcript_2284:157-741(-)